MTSTVRKLLLPVRVSVKVRPGKEAIRADMVRSPIPILQPAAARLLKGLISAVFPIRLKYLNSSSVERLPSEADTVQDRPTG